jgi:uncharacterized protein YodC (DUF2158 family)
MDNYKNFAVGDVVKVKSGGPEMTIESIDDYAAVPGAAPDYQAKCVWFDGKNRKEGFFKPEMLSKVE